MPYYVPYSQQARPTRNEVLEALIETHIIMTKVMKKLNCLIKREQAYIDKRNNKST
ncbi:MAG: hypothetical protein ACLRFK_02960 [Alphaproteobacteria bacterium]